MRAIAVVCVLCGVAFADAKTAVRALVERNLAAFTSWNPEQFNATLDAHAFTPDIQPMEPPQHRVWGSATIGANPAVRIVAQDLKSLTVVPQPASVSAYFIGDIDATWYPPGDDKPLQHTPVRVHGIAKQVDKAWKLVAIEYARTLPDKELFALGDPTLKPQTASHSGSPVADIVAAWFEGDKPVPIEHDRATIAAVVARGTAPGEVASGAVAADKLVKQWDTLHMFHGWITANQYADSCFVTAEVGLPRKGGAVPMQLSAIFVREGDAWRWVSLQFAPPSR